MILKVVGYLEKNRNKKIINVERMTAALCLAYPKYQRLRLSQFQAHFYSALGGAQDYITSRIARDQEGAPVESINREGVDQRQPCAANLTMGLEASGSRGKT